jgi:hypothetical protein
VNLTIAVAVGVGTLVLVGLQTWFLGRMVRRKRRAAEAFGAWATARGLTTGPDGLLAVPVQSRSVSLRTSVGKRAFLTLALPLERRTASRHERPMEAPPRVLLRREARRDRLGKWLGLNREAQVGDSRFDADVYLESEDGQDVLARALSAPATREAIMALLGQGCNEVSIEVHAAGAVTARWLGDWPDGAGIESAARTLVELERTLPPFERVSRPRQLSRGARVIIASVAWLVAGGAMAAGGILGWPTIGGVGPDEVGATFGLGLWGILVFVVFWLVRGRFNGLRALVISGALLLMGSVAGGVGGGYIINGAMDFEPLSVHRVKVIGKRAVGSRSPTLYLDVAPWEGTSGTTLRVSRGQYDRVREGDDAFVRVGRGVLGYAWLDDVSRTLEAPSR